MAAALRFLEDFRVVLWIALTIAIAVFVVAGVSLLLGPFARWIEIRALPIVMRRARVHHGLPPDASPWACESCSSVNVPTAAACYHCGVPRPSDAVQLRDAATDPNIFHRPVPASQFDASRYRGPGAPPPALSAPSAPPPARPDPAESSSRGGT